MNEQWAAYQDSKAFADRVATLYGAGEDVLALQKARYGKLVERFEARFGAQKGGLCFFSAPGRTEIGGNHTDHNNGRVLAAAVNLDTIACVSRTDDNAIVVDSEGFAPITVKLDNLDIREKDFGTTLALIRGTAGMMKEMGYKVGGFRATISSSVLRGSGLSSSAAFEVLIAAILDGLYNGFVVDAKTRAVIAQKVENVYFGKPCGLMDQMASSVGGMVTIDFKETGREGGSHRLRFCGEGLRALRGQHRRRPRRSDRRLRGNPQGDGGRRGALRQACAARGGAGDGGKPHRRAAQGLRRPRRAARAALLRRERPRAGAGGGDSRRRSARVLRRGEARAARAAGSCLQNVYARPTEEQMAMGIELSRRFLHGDGAQRVHGGGFRRNDSGRMCRLTGLDDYKKLMEDAFGPGSCTALMVRPEGAVMMPMEG